MGTVSPLTRFQHIRFSLPLQPILLRSLVLDCTTLVKPEPCGERDQSSAIGSTPFLLGDVNKMSASRPSWRGLCREGVAASVLGKKVGLWGQSEPPSQARRRCSELCAFGPCGEGSQKPSHWHYIAALPGLHVKMPPLASTVFLGQAVDKLFDLSSASLCGREPIRAHLVPGHSWPFLSGH